MRKIAIVNVLLAILFIAVAGCATMKSLGHKYIMKGQILDVSNGEVSLCIGSADGATVGQELPVYRYIVVPKGPYTGVRTRATPLSYRRETVGSVKITQIVDEHFARATILQGDLKENDVAELAY